MICEIETPTGTIYASDRNKYVGGTFYEALLVLPTIGRTVGEWLSPELQFSTLQLELSNVDGRFNKFLPGGASYGGWIGKTVTVKIGLAEQAATYTTIFAGTITDVGGFKRTVKSVVVIARDNYDKVNVSFPSVTMTEAAYPKIEAKNVGKLLPVIYGDWTVATEPVPASVPGFVVNGNDPLVTFQDKPVAAVAGAIWTVVDHDFDANDPVQLTTSGTLPSPFSLATTYYVKQILDIDNITLSATPGGANIVASGGSGDHRIIADPAATRRQVHCAVASNSLYVLYPDQIYLKRGSSYYAAPAADITILGLNNEFKLTQNTGNLWVDGVAYLYESGDEFYCKLKGEFLPDGASYFDNIVSQAKHILKTYGGLTDPDFDTSWATYRDKASPAQSAISTFKSRVWIGEATPVMTYALSMLEQVRLEAFIDRNLKLKINPLHFEDWDASPAFTVRNWDVVKDSFNTSIDEKNNFNAGQGVFNYLPDVGENAYATAVFQNPDAIGQVGKRIAKEVVFPNLYEQPVVEDQLAEILRLASATFEIVTSSLTWRATLLDIGDFVLVNVQIGSAIFDNIPAMIREIGYDPAGLQIIVKLWSLAMMPFPGYVPGYAGTKGGYSATIVQET